MRNDRRKISRRNGVLVALAVVTTAEAPQLPRNPSREAAKGRMPRIQSKEEPKPSGSTPAPSGMTPNAQTPKP